MKPSVLAVLALAALAGCATVTPEERRAADEATCRDYGFRSGSEAFAECLQRIDLDRRAEQRARLHQMEFSRPVVINQPVIVRRPARAPWR